MDKDIAKNKKIRIPSRIEREVPESDEDKSKRFESEWSSTIDAELKMFQLKMKEAELSLKLEEIKKQQADTGLRDKYSFKAFKVVKKSLWGWAILLSIYGVIKFLTRHEYNGQGFEIFSDNVLIAITTATTLNIFAAFLSLIRGLFPSIEHKEKDKKEKSKS